MTKDLNLTIKNKVFRDSTSFVSFI